jgi:hypothetical protein
MKPTIILALAMLAFFTATMSNARQLPAARSDFSVAVVSPSEGRMCYTELSAVKSINLDLNTGPNCGIYVAQISQRWADSKVPPRSPRGELVSGFKFTGWMEGGKAKVAVWALLNPKEATFATTDEKKLSGQLIDTYLIDPGEKLRLRDIESYGTKPIDLVITTRK